MATKRKSKTKAAAPKRPIKKSTPAVAEKSKQDRLIGMLRRPQGATLEQMVKALGWQAHTVRGVISGALKKRLGLKVASIKEEQHGRVYRILAADGSKSA